MTHKILANSAWNLAGQILPLAAAVTAIPTLIRTLGAERFGVLTLLWGLVGYFSMFDLGIGRALTKVVAERLTTPTLKIPLVEIVGTGLALTGFLGLLGAFLLFGLGGLIGHSILPAYNVAEEAASAICTLSPAIFLVILASSLRGVLE